MMKRMNLKSLKSSVESIKSDKKPIASSLLQQAIFCEKTLNKLKKIIDAEGTTCLMAIGKNGNLVECERPEMKSYNALIKNYNALVKNLYDIIEPELEATDPNDDLDKFNNELY